MFSSEEIKVTNNIANTKFRDALKSALPAFVWLIVKTFFPKIAKVFTDIMPEVYEQIEVMREFRK